jgi:F like protein
MNASQRRKYGRMVTAINRRQEDKYRPGIRMGIMSKVRGAQRALKTGGVDAAIRYLMETPGNELLATRLRVLYRNVGLLHARRVNAELRRDVKSGPMVYDVKRLGFNSEWTGFIDDYLLRYLFSKIVMQIDGTTREALLRAIRNGVAEGMGADDIYRVLSDWPYARFQAARIIRTEINRAANVGSMAAGSTFEYEQSKEWIAAKDPRTRGHFPQDHADHWHLDGQVIDENDTFQDPRNGDQLAFPGDPNGSAASVINCRCSCALVGKRGEDGRLIPKKPRQSRVSVIRPEQNINNRRIVLI